MLGKRKKIYEHNGHCNMQTGVLGYIATSDVQTTTVQYLDVTIHNFTARGDKYHKNNYIEGKFCTAMQGTR
jgi:hypothetical protein